MAVSARASRRKATTDLDWVDRAAAALAGQVAREILSVAPVLPLTVCLRSVAEPPAVPLEGAPAAVVPVEVLAVAAEVDEVVAVADAAAVADVAAVDAVAAALPIAMCSSATGSTADAASSFRAAFSKPSETRF